MSGADDQRAVEERFPHRRDIRLWLARHADDEPVTIHVGRTGYGTMTVDRLRAELGEVDRLRAELAETRAAGDDQCRYCPNDADRDEAGFLHCIECGWTDNPGKVVGLHETIDRLRAELAETRDRRDYLQGQLDIIYDAEYSRNDALKRRIEKLTAAGDALAAAGRELYDSKTWSGKALTDARQAFIDAHAGWRSVRGDAPTQPPAAGVSVPQKSTESPDGDQ